MSIRINIEFGNSSVQTDDISRAERAAEAVIGTRDAAQIYAEYQRQWLEFDDEAPMTGDALLWIEATKAADLALTKGWHNPGGASCSISA
jgi:hypothetical protein